MSLTTIATENGIATVTLSRPKVNAFNEEFVDHLRDTFRQLEADKDVRAVILTGQGSFFSFGLDVPELHGYSQAEFTRFLTKFTSLYLTMFEFSKPLVAAINGHAVAGGFMIATPCDYRVMVSGRAKIALNEITFGSAVFAGSLEILKCVVGHRNAELFALGGKMYSAKEAQKLGLIDEVVSSEALLDQANAAATEMAERDTVAFAQIKKLLRGPVAERIKQAEAASIRRFVEIWYAPATREKTKGIVIKG